MLEEIDVKYLGEESFVDSYIKSCDLNMEDKKLKIIMENSWLYDKQSSTLRKCELVVEDWETLIVQERVGSEIRVLDENLYKQIGSIIEYHYVDDTLTLNDVGNMCDVDWIFKRPNVRLYGEIISE